MRRPRQLIVALACASSIAASVYALLVRPRINRWGATEEEVHKVLPGDELVDSIGHRLLLQPPVEPDLLGEELTELEYEDPLTEPRIFDDASCAATDRVLDSLDPDAPRCGSRSSSPGGWRRAAR